MDALSAEMSVPLFAGTTMTSAQAYNAVKADTQKRNIAFAKRRILFQGLGKCLVVFISLNAYPGGCPAPVTSAGFDTGLTFVGFQGFMDSL